MYHYKFSSIDRTEWLRSICEVRKLDLSNEEGITFELDDIPMDSIKPEHLVTFACLIDELKNKKGVPRASIQGGETGAGIMETFNLPDYWGGGKNYSRSKRATVLNLQRVIKEEKDFHAINVANYLRNTFFQKKDLSPVSSSLTEAYYNIFDHANADGNAFSMLEFDETKKELHVAICDFGIGIARSVKDFLNEDISDIEALEKALEDNFTIRSTIHNSGQGLGNILSSCTDKDYLWIICNSAAVAANSSSRRFRKLDFEFVGTLIFYSMSLSHFDDEEVLDEFDL